MGVAKTGTTYVTPARDPGDPAMLRLVVRSAADIGRLKAESRKLHRLPESGIRVLVDGLPAAAADRLEFRTRRYIRACGCGEVAAAGIVILGLAALYRGLEIVEQGWMAADALFALAALVTAGAGMGAAKLGAIALERRRFERCCDETIASIERRQDAARGQS